MGEQGGEQSEDCLTTTIWAPAPLDRLRPMLVWIHGGAFMSGGVVPWYDGAKLARENDMVVVGLNYRLGALGLLCRPGLADGNMGLLDQIRALEWLAENAACFGADPTRIPLMGQSAGAVSITCMLAMPDVRRLFQRAILLSGGFMHASFQSPDQAAAVAKTFCANLGVDSDASDALTRLQSLPVDRILDAQSATIRGIGKAPGDVMPTFMLAANESLPATVEFDLAAREGAASIDALVGTVAEEMRLFSSMDPRMADLSADDLPAIASRLFGDDATYYLEGAAKRRPGATSGQILSDAQTEQFVRGAWQVAEAVAEGSGSAWLFRFDWSAPDSGLGACHCIDLPFVFGNLDAFKGARMLAGAAQEQMSALSAVLRATIGRFVQNGSPAGPEIPNWPAFTRSRPVFLRFDALTDLAQLDASRV